MNSLEKLEHNLQQPSQRLVDDLRELEGDLIILGVGGKMGPDLARLAQRGLRQAGKTNRVIGVSRFSDKELQQKLEDEGIQTLPADLLDETQLTQLPEVSNVLYLAGTKFGTSGQESFTWAMNTYLPGRVAEKFRSSRIVAFSTGNVYPFVPVYSGGATEDTTTGPVGEYAQSCLGRERIFTHFSGKHQTPLLFFRLNYAVDFRYGVLLEIGKSVLEERDIDLTTGHVNVIWQGDANEYALRALKLCSTPPTILNITGPETVAVRWAAQEFGKLMGKEPRFVGEEQGSALLNNAAAAHRQFGYPRIGLKQMIELLTTWLTEGGELHQKPTHFQERKGNF